MFFFVIGILFLNYVMLCDFFLEIEYVMVRLLFFFILEFCCDNFGIGGFFDEKKSIEKGCF